MMGLIPGLLLVFFILNKKGASCSGYLPNSRVIAETLSKKPKYTAAFEQEMKGQNVTEKFLRDSILTEGFVDFEKSDAQRKPCPTYTLIYPKKNPRYEVQFEKCSDTATFNSLKSLQ